MKRLIPILLFLTLLTPVLATGVLPPIFVNKAAVSRACTDDTASTNFIARTSGLSNTEKDSVCFTIKDLEAGGLITGNLSGANGCGAGSGVLDFFYFFGSNNATNAGLNICGTNFTLVVHGSPTFTPDIGYTGDASAAYLDTQYNPTSVVLNCVQNSCSLGSYIQTNTASVASVVMGAGTGGGFLYQSPVNTGNVFTYGLNDTTFQSPANSNPKGAWVSSRTTASAIALYKNGSLTPFDSNAGASSTGLVNLSLFLLGLNNSGSPASFTNYQVSCAWLGGGETAAQAVAAENACNHGMTVLGHNVY